MVTFATGTDPERPGLQPTKPSRMARPARYQFVIGELRKNAAERLRVSEDTDPGMRGAADANAPVRPNPELIPEAAE
jgi:hypothetical protein